ncbi:DUF2357 domain-containing protein [Spirulina sp. CS-785/01]|uniref:DUF2357 domain-containing protein n=1 Tax=Spirulina sp. CS-785/01 TaxID=3021716 RepID=UPI00232F1EA7|nr:DUF2357 domain-containing protein [Spirulina sp. CS-785/01]MDB9312246.1 DUF2357 domain-containing protein [Spirulina sp. CS-785/01]
MLIYRTLADYIHRQPLSCHPDMTVQLQGKDRPFLELEKGEKLLTPYGFLVKRTESLYEVGFPWVQVSDWETHSRLIQHISLEIESWGGLHLELADEVLDETQITNDEKTAQRLQEELGKACDRMTAETISLFVGLFNFYLNAYPKKACNFITIPDAFCQVSQDEARLPLVLTLERHYELRHKLELITSKLRTQMNRTRELIPLGRIQEMDAYCLRDYIRRPGRNALEKAGSRQELMGVKRYQNYNTPENRFLKGFCELLHLDCHDYRDHYPEAKALENTINRFRQEPTVQTIPHRHTFTVKPNYVLQQNPIYRSFYQAYLDYLKRRTEKEKLWGFRQRLLVDVGILLFTAALLNLDGSYVEPLAQTPVKDSPDYGCYLTEFPNHSITIHCILQTAILTFTLQDSPNPTQGDFQLHISLQHWNQTDSPKAETWPIWVFWYKPTADIINGLENYPSNTHAIYLYLYDTDDPTPDEQRLLHLPHPIKEDLDTGVRLLSETICQRLGGGLG